VSYIACWNVTACMNSVLHLSSSVVVCSGVPAPGKYKYDDSELRPVPSLFWSRSTYKRFQDLGMDNKVPG